MLYYTLGQTYKILNNRKPGHYFLGMLCGITWDYRLEFESVDSYNANNQFTGECNNIVYIPGNQAYTIIV